MMVRKRNSIVVWCAAALMAASVCLGQERTRIGIEEHLGQVVPLETFTFADETGQPIKLDTLFDKPVALTLVYYRCPGICTPLLQELASVADKTDLMPGQDYRLVTISFDPAEKADLAKNKKANMLAAMEKKNVPADGWRFLTGDEENIRRITEAVGFYYARDKNQADYVHASAVIFLSPEGKIVRYLTGTQFNPADLKMAVLDASAGRPRSFVRKIQQLCYTYDSEGKAYVLRINRIILGVTVLFGLMFGGFLLLKGRSRKQSGNKTGVETGASAP